MEHSVKPTVCQKSVEDPPGLMRAGSARNEMMPGATVTLPQFRDAVSDPDVTINEPDFVPGET